MLCRSGCLDSSNTTTNYSIIRAAAAVVDAVKLFICERPAAVCHDGGDSCGCCWRYVVEYAVSAACGIRCTME